MSHVSGGLVYKRFLNALRPAGGPTPDPFFANVLLLAPFSDNGTNFVDYGPLANPAIFLDGGNPVLFQQNNKLLFGQNTLRVFNDLGQQFENSIQFLNVASPLTPTDDLCFEYFINQSVSSNSSTAPLHFFFNQTNNVGAATGQRVNFYTAANTLGNDLQFSCFDGFTPRLPYSLNSWVYVACQFVAASSTAYLYLNGVQVSQFSCSLENRSGWRTTIASPLSGPSVNFYDMNIGQLRITKANRYGNVPTIAIPVAPFSTF